jgi:hypothetical protein
VCRFTVQTPKDSDRKRNPQRESRLNS